MEVLEPILKGLLTGIIFTMTFGTVFFSLIQTSIKRGHRKSVFIACGVLLSDALYISIAVFGSSFIVAEINHYDHIIRLVGFSFLAFLGIRSIMKHETLDSDDKPVQEKNGLLYMMKGVMLNSINPMTLIAWLGIVTFVETVDKFTFDQVLLFFTAVLTTMFSCMILIGYFAQKLRKVLSERNIHRLNIFSGIIFMIFALVIIWPVLIGLF